MCVMCLGLKHAQAAFESTEECTHCERFSLKVLCRRLARQTNLSGSDPVLASTSEASELMDMAVATAPEPEAGPSWGSQLSLTGPFSQELDGPGLAAGPLDFLVERAEDDLDGGSELLMTDEDDDDDSSLGLSGRVAKLQPSTTAVAGDGSSSPAVDLDLQDVCKRAATKLNIQWPEVQAEVTRSRYDGKKLPKVKRTGKQLLPIFPELLEELAVSWRDKPYREKHPVVGSSMLDCEGMERHGLRNIPPVEPVVAAHLHPKASLSSLGPALPSRADRFQSSLTDKAYKAAALSARALNATSLLMAYQAELEEEMTASPDPVLWEEMCVITDHCLHLHKVAIQSQGRAMGLMVLQERARWLNLTTLSAKEKEDLLDTPISPKGLFGAAVTSMQKRCEERKREDEALKLCLPRRAPTATLPAHRQTFAQAVARPPPTFKIPKLPKSQAAPQAPPRAQAPKGPWQKKSSSQEGTLPDRPPPTFTHGVRRRKRQA